MKRNTKRVAYKCKTTRKTIRKTKMKRIIQRGGTRITIYTTIAGRQIAKSGDYQGETNDDGQPNGQGRMSYDSGSVYEGSWLNGEMSGRGIMRYNADGSVYYDGEWLRGHKYGIGRFVTATGTVLEGQWDNSQLINGTVTYAGDEAGNVYIGQLSNGQRHGQGKMTYADGTWHEGKWREGIENGTGRMFDEDGNYYEGEWVDGFMTRGMMIEPNGNVYKGEFRDGMKNGRGEMMYNNGTYAFGIWINDELTHVSAENLGVASRTRGSGTVPSKYEIGPSQALTNPVSFSTIRRPVATIRLSDGFQYDIATAKDLYRRIQDQVENRQQITNLYNTTLTQEDMNKLAQFIHFSVGGKKRRAISK